MASLIMEITSLSDKRIAFSEICFKAMSNEICYSISSVIFRNRNCELRLKKRMLSETQWISPS